MEISNGIVGLTLTSVIGPPPSVSISPPVSPADVLMTPDVTGSTGTTIYLGGNANNALD